MLVSSMTLSMNVITQESYNVQVKRKTATALFHFTVIIYYLVAAFHTGAYSLRWFICKFNCHLKQTDWEFFVHFGRYPKPKRVINVLRFDENINNFRAKAQRQMNILQQNPASV